MAKAQCRAENQTVKWGEAAAIFAAYGVWRAMGNNRAGAVVGRALASVDETNRTVAGILLVRGAARSLPLLRANLQHGLAVPMTLRILGDIGDQESARDIEPYVQSGDPATARAADAALALIRQPR